MIIIIIFSRGKLKTDVFENDKWGGHAFRALVWNGRGCLFERMSPTESTNFSNSNNHRPFFSALREKKIKILEAVQ